ncbi:MAG TPA: plastocyanin/azurin family copper-binding protein [Candidatus Binataceae bacterium]|nr:plastocyanin/azurin family copper-binding protein [Candidatus Binataceae bacterium]
MVALAAGFTVAGSALAATVEVKMTDTPPVYIPKKVTIKVGDTVKWTNNAQTLHTVTFDPAKAVDKSDVVLPKGVAPFDSGFLMPGKDFSYTFKAPGQYKYFCIPHEKDGMVGFVTVKK